MKVEYSQLTDGYSQLTDEYSQLTDEYSHLKYWLSTDVSPKLHSIKGYLIDSRIGGEQSGREIAAGRGDPHDATAGNKGRTAHVSGWHGRRLEINVYVVNLRAILRRRIPGRVRSPR